MAESESTFQPELEAQESAEQVVKYYSYCPRGTDCRKGNKTLGGFWNEDAAREAVFTHLRHSTYHKLSEREAGQLADNAEIIVHAWEEGKESDEDFIINSGGTPSRASTSAKVRARPTDRPTEPAEPPRSRPRSEAEEPPRSRRRRNPEGSSTSQAVAVVNQQLQDGIAVQTRNAMSFVRAMTRAEKALRLAETVSRRAMETFQDMVASKGGCTCCGMTACGSTAKGFLDFL